MCCFVTVLKGLRLHILGLLNHVCTVKLLNNTNQVAKAKKEQNRKAKQCSPTLINYQKPVHVTVVGGSGYRLWSKMAWLLILH